MYRKDNLWVKILAVVLAGLMVIGILSSVIFSIL